MNILRWTVSWGLYWIGDGISRLIEELPDNYCAYLLAETYQKFMGWSVAVQGSSGQNGPWSAAQPEGEQTWCR